MHAPFSYAIVFVGAGLGGALRHGANILAAERFGTHLPVGTFVVNVCGSLLMGVVAGYFVFQAETAQTTRLFLATGVLGGFTTFSAFAWETTTLLENGRILVALGYVLASVVLSVAGVFAGLVIARQ